MPLVREALNAASKDEQAVSRATGQHNDSWTIPALFQHTHTTFMQTFVLDRWALEEKLETALERSFCLAPRGAQNPSNVWYVLF